MKLTYHTFLFPLAILFFLVLALCSCEKDLDFEYHDIAPLTVVEGTLDQNGATVTVTYTTPMDEPFASTQIKDATVFISDLNSGESWQLLADANGNFTVPVNPTVGHKYELSVEKDGQSYSARSKMLPATEILSLEWGWVDMLGQDVAALQIVFKDTRLSDNEMYWIRVYRNGEDYNWSLLGKHLSLSDTLTEVVMTTRRDPEDEDAKTNLYAGDVLKVTVTPIGEEMFDYLWALLYTGSNGRRMFSGDFCLGYFLASPVASAEIVYHPDEIERYK